MEASMPADRDDRTRKPSVIDLVTDPEQFDRWQRQREREEASDDRAPEPGNRPGRGDGPGNGPGNGRGDDRSGGDPRDIPSDRRS